MNQGGRSWRAFGERKINPQSFRRARICKFSRQKHCFFTIAGKQAICGCQKTYTHTGTFPQTPFLMFRYVLWLCSGRTKALQKWALQKLYESRLYKSSLKALQKLSDSSPKALRKLSENSLETLQKLSESRLSKSSPKAG